MIGRGITLVREYFEARRVPAAVVFGRRAHARRLNQGIGGANRVVFQPGDDGGRLGQLAAVHQPGQREIAPDVTARSLANWRALYSVFVWAVAPAASAVSSPSRMRDELEDFEAAEELLQWTIRAVHWAFDGHASWVGDVEVLAEPAELVHGVELRAALTVGFPLYDTPLTRVYPAGIPAKGSPP